MNYLMMKKSFISLEPDLTLIYSSSIEKSRIKSIIKE